MRRRSAHSDWTESQVCAVEFIKRKLESSSTTSSKWKVVRNCIPRRECSQPVYTRDLKEVTNEFNQFFTSVGAKASEDSHSLIDLHNLPSLSPRTSQMYISEADKFCFHAVSRNEVTLLHLWYSVSCIFLQVFGPTLARLIYGSCRRSRTLRPGSLQEQESTNILHLY